MHVESTPTVLARLRRLEVSPERFRQLATASAAMLLVIVATGATVRLTDSGLGCEHWPGCQPGDPFPRKGYHSYVEFSNRIVAFATLMATLFAWVGAIYAPSVARRTRRLAAAVFAGVAAQAVLGPITVHFHLNPWLVIAHMLLSLVVLGGGVVVALEARARPPGEVEPRVRWASLVPLLALSVLVVTGTIVSGSGPHPGGAGASRLPWFETAVWLHVRAATAFGLTALALLAWSWRRRDWVRRATLLLLALFAAQAAVGETQYRTRLPWGLVLAHVTLAASVWAVAVGLVVSLWRARTVAPPAA